MIKYEENKNEHILKANGSFIIGFYHFKTLNTDSWHYLHKFEYLITLLQSFNKLVCKNNHTQDLWITIFRVKTMLVILEITQGYTNFSKVQKQLPHSKHRSVRWSEFHIEDPQILGTTV
jgi:hypothetical protein